MSARSAFRVGHVDDMRAVRHLMGGRVDVAIHRHHFDAETLGGDGDFLAELAAAEQQDARGTLRKRCSDHNHDAPR